MPLSTSSERVPVAIVGAGMAGLLAARMLARRKPVVLERQEALPNNHSAVLRFRSPTVGDVTGIPFRKVSMIKGPVPWRNPVADALAYSRKNLGVMRSDRSITAGLVSQERYIAPPDFIARLADGADIRLNSTPEGRDGWTGPMISTIPMPALMKALGYPNQPDFTWVPGCNITARIIGCEAYVSLMVPDPDYLFSRVSITGDELIVEYPNRGTVVPSQLGVELDAACGLLGIGTHQVSHVEIKPQTYAKIAPIDDEVRKVFMHWATDQHGVFSLGRFATWRPNLLLDDLVQDIRKIDAWIGGGRYNLMKDR